MNKRLASKGGKPVRKTFLPFSLPLLGEEERNELQKTLDSGWITTGPKTRQFEMDFKKYIGSKYAIAVSSCTAALHLSLAAIGVDDGDEVVTTPFTFAATGNVVVHQKAKPVFVDISKQTLNVDPEKIEKKITAKTKAIIPVHFAGQPCDMDEILKIARRRGILVIEDAAHAVGAEYKGEKIGTIGDITTFSFYPIKNITTGEGGMVTTNNKKWADKIRVLSLHGITSNAWKRYSSKGSWYYEIMFAGYKYNMTDMQASLGIHQLKKLPKFLESRTKFTKIYDKAFNSIPQIILPRVDKKVKHARHLYTVLLNLKSLRINRDDFIKELYAENIGASVHFIPLHLHPYYKKSFGYKKGDFPNAEYIYERIISLPLYPKMCEEDVHNVIEAVEKIIKYYSH